MRGPAPGRAAAAVTGAILGGLIFLGFDAVGVIEILKAPGVPFGFLLVVAGALVGITPLRPLLWIGAGAVVLVVLLAMYTPMTVPLTAPLVRSDSVGQKKLDAIAVLSGGSTVEGMMGPLTLDRLLKASSLARAHVAPAMMISREIWEFADETVTDRTDQEQVLAMTLPDSEQVFFVDSVSSTRNEAERMKKIADPHGWKRIAVVTSPLHSRRACATFESVGFEVTCVTSPSREMSLGKVRTPGDRLKAFSGWLYEVAGTLKY